MKPVKSGADWVQLHRHILGATLVRYPTPQSAKWGSQKNVDLTLA